MLLRTSLFPGGFGLITTPNPSVEAIFKFCFSSFALPGSPLCLSLRLFAMRPSCRLSVALFYGNSFVTPLHCCGSFSFELWLSVDGDLIFHPELCFHPYHQDDFLLAMTFFFNSVIVGIFGPSQCLTSSGLCGFFRSESFRKPQVRCLVRRHHSQAVDQVFLPVPIHAFSLSSRELSCQHAGTYNFRSHGRARFQRNCNFPDCDPLVSVNCSDHCATPSPAIIFTAIPIPSRPK